MADAYTVESKLDGLDSGRKPYGYRLVDLWRTFTVGDKVAYPDPALKTASVFDHIAMVARVVTKKFVYRGEALDQSEMLATILTRLDEIESKL